MAISAGTNQLIALASGGPTPVAQNFPTDTPVPTGLPTPTPATAGSAIAILDSDGQAWQVQVTQVLVADSLQPASGESVETAAGRFAILFMDVTNRGISVATFVAFSTLDVQDAEGQISEENTFAGFYARDLYGADLCAKISPGQTKHCVAVYDISRQSAAYELVPGALADPYGPRLSLTIP